MNLTKSLKWALACAGITALSASAFNWVADDFDYSGGTAGTPILQIASGQWSESGGLGASALADADAARLGFNVLPTPMEGADGFVLELNTEGSTLKRVVDPTGLNPADFSLAPRYVDMMVKFVLSEDEPTPPNDGGVKALIYANADSNLVVYSLVNVSGNTAGFSALQFGNAVPTQIDPEQWYRLTLKWFNWDLFGDQSLEFVAFTIELNGQIVSGSGGFDPLDPEFGVGDKVNFLTAAGFPGMWDYTLESIEFQGTGFIDELVVTDTLPNFGSGGPTYFANDGVNVVDKNDYDAWQGRLDVADSITTAGGVKDWMLSAYLLNVDPGTTATKAKLVIKKITPTVTGADVLLKAIDGNGFEVPFDSPYGTLKLFSTPSLDVPFTLQDSIKPAMDDEYPILGPGAVDKYFFRATIE